VTTCNEPGSNHSSRVLHLPLHLMPLELGAAGGCNSGGAAAVAANIQHRIYSMSSTNSR
jgi:hypothetical protein